MEKVLDRKEVATRGKRYQKYLVKWVRLPYEDSSWISEEELRSLSGNAWKKFRERGLQEGLQRF